MYSTNGGFDTSLRDTQPPQSVISFSEMSKDVLARVCEANSVSKNHEVIFTTFFEITKEGRKTYGNIFSRMLKIEDAFERGTVSLLG